MDWLFDDDEIFGGISMPSLYPLYSSSRLDLSHPSAVDIPSKVEPFGR